MTPHPEGVCPSSPSASTMTIQQNISPITQNSKGLADLDVRFDQNSPLNQVADGVQASRVIVTRAEVLKPLPPTDDLVFGKVNPFHEASALYSLRSTLSTTPII